MEQYGSTLEASQTSCPSQKQKKNTVCTTIAQARKKISSTYPEEEMGLFYSDITAGQGAVLLNIVDHNKSKCSERDYTRALLAHKLRYNIALPSHRHLVKIVEDKVQMLNFPLN